MVVVVDELIFGKQSLNDEGSWSHWWQKKLESRLQTLLNAVKVFSYSRTENNGLVVEALIDDIDQLLSECEQGGFAADEDEACVDRLVLIETYQLLAQARSLIGSPKHYGFDNVVELYPGAMRFPKADVFDAEFEAQLAASDLPLLLKDEAVGESNNPRAPFLSLVRSDCPAHANDSDPANKIKAVFNLNSVEPPSNDEY